MTCFVRMCVCVGGGEMCLQFVCVFVCLCVCVCRFAFPPVLVF